MKMKNLIMAEFFKLAKSLAYKIMMALSLLVGLFFGFFWLCVRSSLPLGYQMLPVMDSFVMFHTIFTSVFTAVFLCREFSDRTIGMGLSCGLPRHSVFLSKAAVFFMGLLCLLSVAVVVPIVLVSIVNGLGIDTIGAFTEFLTQVVFFWLVSAAMGSFFLLLAVATKNTTAAMGTGLGISYFMLVLSSNYVNAGIEIYSLVKYSFICQMFILGDWVHLNKGLFLGVSLVTLITSLIASTLIFEKTELK